MKRAAPQFINYLAVYEGRNYLAVYEGRQLLGYILESDDGAHQAVTAEGEIIGTYRKRQEAAQAITAPTR